METTTRLWFIRHGEVESPYVGTFLGSTDVGLSDVGVHQAQAVAGFLEPMEIDALLASPLRRAQDSAAPTAAARGMEIVVAPWAQEMHFGDWEGKTWEENMAANPSHAAEWQADPANVPCPGAGTTTEFAARVHAGLAETLQEYAGKAIALFAHAGTNRAIISSITGQRYMDAFAFSQDYGCVNAAAWDLEAGHGQVAMLNVVPGPPSEQHGDGGRRIT